MGAERSEVGSCVVDERGRPRSRSAPTPSLPRLRREREPNRILGIHPECPLELLRSGDHAEHDRIDRLMDATAPGDVAELSVLAILVEKYERDILIRNAV